MAAVVVNVVRDTRVDAGAFHCDCESLPFLEILAHPWACRMERCTRVNSLGFWRFFKSLFMRRGYGGLSIRLSGVSVEAAAELDCC